MAREKLYNGITIDYERDRLIPERGLALLTGKGFYKKEHENSPQETYARAATCYSFGDYELSQRIYDYVSKGWFTFASPVLSNAVDVEWPSFDRHSFEEAGDWLETHVKPDGMPISCFLNMVPDSKKGLVETSNESRELSMQGGGIGTYFGNRSPDEKSTGVMAHVKGYDADTLAYRQTATRRGSMAAYMDIDHPEILAFIQMRNPVGGDQNKKCFNMNNAVNITDKFMYAVLAGEKYELVDPKHGATGRFLDARGVWEELMDVRYETGEPYLLFIDTVNRNIPSWINHPLYRVLQSNLCTEIMLMTSKKRTAVCCLSSLNLAKYDEWKDTKLVADLVRFLDNVLEYFIRLAPVSLERAVRSAKKERAIGIGTLGWHSFLQSKMIPFESGGINSAAQWTNIMYKEIKQQAETASKAMAEYRGESPDCAGSGYRNSHLLAIAPNASSSNLVGKWAVSPSIEPDAAVCYNAQGRAGNHLIKNEYFEVVLEKYGLNTDATWLEIAKRQGSVQWITELTQLEKDVFKTFTEIDPMWIIELASIRQLHICQGQSVNISVPAEFSLQEMSDIHVQAWAKGLKALYYCRATKPVNVEIGTGGKEPLNAVRVKVEFNECISCEG